MEKSKDSWQGQNKKGITKLRAALTSAKSADEMLKIFRKIEARLDENQLGSDCWKIAAQLHQENQDPLKILSFGKRALNIMLRDETSNELGIHGSSFIISDILYFLGSACFELKRYDECLSYLNWADWNLSKLSLDNFDDNYVLKILHNTHIELSKVKRVMGKGDEVVFHLKKVLEISEKNREKGCTELGWDNMNVSDGYLEIGNFKEALPFALKALEIFKNHFANDSSELTMLRTSLGGIYLSLGEVDKAFEQNRLSLSGFKSMGNASLLFKAEAEGGKILVDSGRYEEAIEVLKPLISQSENVGDQRARALVYMSIAKAFCRLEKYADALKYIKIAIRILEKKGLDVGALATGFMSMSKLYEDMKEYEMAISLVQKALNIPELPQHHLDNCCLRIFSLISLNGTEKIGISFLEQVVERLKEKFGPEHCNVGYAYASLGIAYMDLGRPETAEGCFVRAKDIFDVSLGPHHLTSLRASQALSAVYASMKSYDLAIEIHQKIVECFKGLGLSEQVISEVLESHTSALHQCKDGEDLSATNSKCGVSDSDDGKLV